MRTKSLVAIWLALIASFPAPAALAGPVKGDVLGGASLWGEAHVHPCGWTAAVDVAVRTRPWGSIGLVADAGGYWNQFGYLPTLMGGVRWTWRRTSVAPYAQILAGHGPLDDFAIQPGAGLDWFSAGHVGVRLGGDVKYAGDDGSDYVGVRLSAGMVIRF